MQSDVAVRMFGLEVVATFFLPSLQPTTMVQTLGILITRTACGSAILWYTGFRSPSAEVFLMP